MDKYKEKEAIRKLEELKKKAAKTESQSEDSANDELKEIPREAFRKNMGCGG